MTSVGAVGRLRAAPNGLQRFDAGRDLKAVIELLEIGFRDDLEARDRRWLAELASLSRAGPALGWLMRLFPAPARGFDGYVWYEDGRLVGNVSLMRCNDDVWVMANVVTHPGHRRRGIAADLLDEAINSVASRGARQLQLQVRAGNAAAHGLYEAFGFWRMNAATTMRLPSAAGISRFAHPARGWRIRRLGAGANWDRGRRLLARAGELERGGPTGLVMQALEHHWLWDGLDDWMRGSARQSWVTESQGEYRAIVTAVAVTRHGPHRIDMIVDPRWVGKVEDSLLDAALRSLAGHQPFVVESDVDTRRESVLEAMQAAGFRRVRTLDRLALDLKPLR